MFDSTSWLAGLFEGEGYVGVPPSQIRQGIVHVAVTTTDEDVGKALVEYAGGKLYTSKRKTSTGKSIWSWRLTKNQEMFDFLLRIRPYMHSRRLGAVNSALRVLAQKRSVKPITMSLGG